MAAINPNYMKLPKRFTLWVILVLVLMAVLALALWLDLRHQTPSVTINDFFVQTTTNRNHQPPKIYVNLAIKNPNPVYSLYYDYTVFKVNYTDDTLGQTNTLVSSGFHQPKNDNHEFSDHMEADLQIWKALVKTISNSKEALLKAELKIEIRYHNLGHSSKQYNLKFQGQFNIGSNGKISGGKNVQLCKGSC